MLQENNFLIEKFDSEVLREYDIRGIVDKNITENTAYTIGRIYGYIVNTKLNSNKISLGYDGRLTSPKLFNALSNGLKDVPPGLFDTAIPADLASLFESPSRKFSKV